MDNMHVLSIAHDYCGIYISLADSLFWSNNNAYLPAVAVVFKVQAALTIGASDILRHTTQAAAKRVIRA
jgi:hypothetical protein